MGNNLKRGFVEPGILPQRKKTPEIIRSASAFSRYADTNTSFSGNDMAATIEMPLPGGSYISQVVGSVQTITYSIHDEKWPVRSVGDMNPKGYVFGPRTIAGTIIFTVFDRHWAKKIMEKYRAVMETEAHFLIDEVPPFNITLSFANEYGRKARLALYGITFVNEGQVMSVNDIYTENTYQFYAMDIDYLDDMTARAESGKLQLPSNIGIFSEETEELPDIIPITSDEENENTETGEDPEETSAGEESYYGRNKLDLLSEIAMEKVKADSEIGRRLKTGEIDEAEAERLRGENLMTYYEKRNRIIEWFEAAENAQEEVA